MASLNLSSVLLDPEIGKSFSVKYDEEYLERAGYWGDGKIRTIDDLRLEMDDDAAAKDGEGAAVDDINVREDEDSDEDMITGAVFRGAKKKSKAAAAPTEAGGVSAAELKEIVE